MGSKAGATYDLNTVRGNSAFNSWPLERRCTHLQEQYDVDSETRLKYISFIYEIRIFRLQGTLAFKASESASTKVKTKFRLRELVNSTEIYRNRVFMN